MPPTVEDAIELVTSRGYVAMGASARAEVVEMRAGEIVNALRGVGSDDDTDEITARVLVSEAAKRCGGHTKIEHRPGGLRPGGPVVRAEFRLWMPAAALRD